MSSIFCTPSGLGRVLRRTLALSMLAGAALPASAAVGAGFPAPVTLRWPPLPAAASYSVEIDCYGCCRDRRWCSDVGAPYRIVTGLTQPHYSFQRTEHRPLRWRVWSVDRHGRPGPKSPWWGVHGVN